MADDLVAELTLRLINETNAGIGEIRAELSNLASGVEGSFGDIGAAILADETKMKELGSSLSSSVEAGAVDAIKSIDSIGVAIDANINKVKELQGAVADVGAGTAGGGSETPVPGSQPSEEPAPDKRRIEDPGKKLHGMMDSGNIGDYIALASGYEGAEYDAKLQTLLTNITNTEKIHGAAADAEQVRIGDMMHALAYKYNSDSGDLLAAYNYLITTGIKPREVDALMPGLAEAGTAHGIDPTDMTQAVMALAESYRISPADMGAVLGQLGYATKMGHFGADSFSAFLPQIGGALSAVGVSGNDAADYTFAAMESIIKNVSIPSEAATDYTDFIHYIGTQHAERTFLQKSRMMLPQMRAIFSKYGIGDVDLWGMENAAMAKGEDPVETVLDFVHTATAKMSPTDRNAVVSDYFTNQQGGDAVRALMQYWNGYTNPDGTYTQGFQDNYEELKTVDQTTLDEDFHQAVQGAAGDMRTFGQTMNVLNETLGQIFTGLVAWPASRIVNANIADPLTGNLWSQSGSPTGLGPMHPYPHQIEVNIKVSPDGTVTSARTKAPPGVPVKTSVNQGNVLNAP